jgi:hypothetical protein
VLNKKRQYQKEIRLWVDVSLELLGEDCAQLDQADIEQLRRCIWEVAGPITDTVKFERGSRTYRGTIMFDFPTPYDMKQARLDALAGREFQLGQATLVLNAADFSDIDAMELDQVAANSEKATRTKTPVTVGKVIAPVRATLTFPTPTLYDLKIARLTALAGEAKQHSGDLVA